MPKSPAKVSIEQFADTETELEHSPKKEVKVHLEPKVPTDSDDPKESVKETPDDLVKEKKISPHVPNLYRIMFYMKPFRAHDIVIKIVDRLLVIDAVHKEHVDEHGFVTRSVLRKQRLPKDVVAEKLVSYFTADGILIFQAPRKEEN